MTDDQYERLQNKLKEFELEKAKYRYNLLGLIGIALHQHWERENAFFCSQFLAHVLIECEMALFTKPAYLITPADLIDYLQPQLIYQGRVYDYLAQRIVSTEAVAYEQPAHAFSIPGIKNLNIPVINRFF